jgi:hypothetical protein
VVKPVLIEVRGGVVTSRVYVATGQPVDAEWADFFRSIDGLFVMIEGAASHADSFDADYDARYGYPRRVSIDYDTRMVDDELTLRVGDFHPLQ